MIWKTVISGKMSGKIINDITEKISVISGKINVKHDRISHQLEIPFKQTAKW